MTLELLRSTLTRLSSSSFSQQERARILRDVFSLLEQLVNIKNVTVLVRALLSSSIWSGTESYVVAYTVTDAARYLSEKRATEMRSTITQCVGDLKVVCDWRKTIFLSALVAAELRGHQGIPNWYSSKGMYIPAYLGVLNASAASVSCDLDMKAGLLISISYVYPALSTYQYTKIADSTLVALIDGLYTSRLAFDDQDDILTTRSKRGFRELGFLTRTLSEIIENARLTSSVDALRVLERFSHMDGKRLAKESDVISKPVFLSILTISQCLLTSAARSSMDDQSKIELATRSLQLLRNLHGINEDNSVFESWRFCFHISLDMLADVEHGLSDYFRMLLAPSSLSRYPLSSELYVGSYSKQKDKDDIQWLLSVTEAASSALKSRSTLTRVFDFCHQQLTETPESDVKDTELLHSVLLSLFSSHKAIFLSRMSAYTRFVLNNEGQITDRQFKLIFKTLYSLSLPADLQNTREDPQAILASLKNGISVVEDEVRRTKLISVWIDLLPMIPPQFLSHNLHQVGALLASAIVTEELESHFIETCTTEMDSERAIICVQYLMSRGQDRSLLHEKARL